VELIYPLVVDLVVERDQVATVALGLDLGFLKMGGLGDAAGASPGLSGMSEAETWSRSGLGAPF